MSSISTDEVRADDGPAAEGEMAVAVQPREPAVRDGSTFAVSMGAATLLHLITGWILVGGGLAALFGSDFVGAGVPDGRVDGVTVETIDAREFESKFVSFGTGQDASDSAANAATPPPRPQPQPPAEAAEQTDQPREKDVAERVIATPSQQAALSVPSPAPPSPAVPPTPMSPPARRAPPPSPSLSEADIDEIVAGTKHELERAAATMSMAGSARLGEASPFVRGVLRILKQNMPKPNGLRGTVRIQLFVAASGAVEEIRLAESSGQAELDKIVMETVKATRLIQPGKDTPPRERLFKINYIYN